MYRQFLTQDNKDASDFNFFFFSPENFKKYVCIYFGPCCLEWGLSFCISNKLPGDVFWLAQLYIMGVLLKNFNQK